MPNAKTELHRYFTFFFCTKCLKSALYFTLKAHLSLDCPHFKFSDNLTGPVAADWVAQV